MAGEQHVGHEAEACVPLADVKPDGVVVEPAHEQVHRSRPGGGRPAFGFAQKRRSDPPPPVVGQRAEVVDVPAVRRISGASHLAIGFPARQGPGRPTRAEHDSGPHRAVVAAHAQRRHGGIVGEFGHHAGFGQTQTAPRVDGFQRAEKFGETVAVELKEKIQHG